MMTEKEAIKKAVKEEWNTLMRLKADLGLRGETTRRTLARWNALDELWIELYGDEEY